MLNADPTQKYDLKYYDQLLLSGDGKFVCGISNNIM